MPRHYLGQTFEGGVSKKYEFECLKSETYLITYVSDFRVGKIDKNERV